MLTDDEIGMGFYRFEDLQELRIVENRTDLGRKQADLNFPRPIKTGNSQAAFSKAEVHAWLRQRAALRDATPELPPDPHKTPEKKLKAKAKAKSSARSARRAEGVAA
ncbi:helix-turn-helix transcriptional regulator [Bradyrhizobium barranii]|uniref:helix-turn-helix transcriptional regulator n=1 Tax=Bradyrhizobium barranii TaxID=2992140 RepID=UPI00403470B0